MRRIGSVMLMILVVGLLASPARAAVKSVTLLSVEPVAPVVWGARASVIAHLRLPGGIPVGDYHVDLHLAGDIAGGRTDATGTATFDIHIPDVPGTYSFQVTFSGSSTLLPSAAQGTLTVQPRLLTIRSVPTQEGLTFNLNGTEFVSDADGIARVEVDPTFDDLLRPSVANLQIAPGVEMRFGRWRIHNQEIYATYEIYYSISLLFVDLAGNPVDPARVTKVDLKSAIGSRTSVSADRAFTVLGKRVVPLAGELVPKDVSYTAEDVVVDGANVVHSAQQRFTPSAQRVWTITLLFYSAHIAVRDALFGFKLDANVRVTYPDGQEVGLLTTDGEVSLTAMARGNYGVVAESWGLSFLRPVALSRNQEVELKVISYLDMGVVTGLMLFVVLGLVIVGRPTGTRGLRDLVVRRGARVATAAAAVSRPLAGAAVSGPRLIRAMASGIRHYVPRSAPAKPPRAPAKPRRAPAKPRRAPAKPRPAPAKPRPAPVAQHGRESPVPVQASLIRPDMARRVPREYVVQAGDTLRSIAGTMLGDENAWPEIYYANGKVLFDPDVVRQGTRLRIP